MQNFNTNQTRHFFVAGADKTGSTIANNLDIQVKQAATGEFYFIYKNADGLLTRSDSIDPKKVVSLKKTASADMARPLMMHTLLVDTSAVTLSALVGKTVDCIITFMGIHDYDAANSMSVVATVTGDATNTANATAFHKALAIAIAKALPPEVGGYPLLKVFSNGSEVTRDTAEGSVTGSASGVVLVEAVGKYVRGKLSGEPVPFSVAFRYSPNNWEQDIVWGTDTVAKSNISGNLVYPANYILADLEQFAFGERADYFRGYDYPNNYDITWAIDLSKTYDVLSIEYYWSGNAENIQKSPRMLQIAGAVTAGSGSGAGTGAVDSLYSTVAGYCGITEGSGASSGSGQA